MTNNELIDLIEDALAWFGYSECPYCQVNMDEYIDRNDIEKWLKERIDKEGCWFDRYSITPMGKGRYTEGQTDENE